MTEIKNNINLINYKNLDISERNRTTRYMLPLILEKTIYSDSLVAYLGINKYIDIKPTIYVMCYDKEFEYKLEDTNYNAITNINGHKVFVYILDDEDDMLDYYRFLVGNYSEMKSKRKITSYWRNKNKTITTILRRCFFFKEETRQLMIDNLVSEFDDELEYRRILKQIDEVDSIPQLSDELMLI